MFSVPRGYIDGFVQWGKQIIGLCLTTFLQATILTAGLMVLREHALLGLGLMLSVGEVSRIAGVFGLEQHQRKFDECSLYGASRGKYHQKCSAGGGTKIRSIKRIKL